MALDKSSLEIKILNELKSKGFDTTNEHSKSTELAQAIASAVIDEITSNAEVAVTSGSSAGVYKVS